MSAVAPDKPRAAVAPALRHSEGRDPVSFARYPQYKDSGVAWLGEVPAHWEIAPFKRAATNNDGGVWGSEPDGEDGTIVLRSTEQTVDGNWSIDDPAVRKLTERERTDALLRTGDLVITKSSGSALHIGKTTLVTAEIAQLGCCYSNFMQRVRTSRDLLPKLAWYVLNSGLARSQFDLLSNSTTGLANLNAAMIGRLVIVLPPVGEQEAIAVFLDRETARIDALIAEQEKLIALLKEKRQALISHAVTKGLDPNAPMKDSGIEWLGQVPAHWRIVKTSRHFVAKKGGNAAQLTKEYCATIEGDFPVYSGQTENDGVLSYINTYEFDAGSEGYILSTTVGAKAMSSMHVKGKFSLSQNCMIIVPRQRGRDLRFFFYLFQPLFSYERELIPTHMQASFRMEDLYQYRIPMPPPVEQLAIAEFLDVRTATLDLLANEAEHAIALLKERRAALISAAVTGKICVLDS